MLVLLFEDLPGQLINPVQVHVPVHSSGFESPS